VTVNVQLKLEKKVCGVFDVHGEIISYIAVKKRYP